MKIYEEDQGQVLGYVIVLFLYLVGFGSGFALVLI